MITEDYCSKEVRNLLVTKGFLGDMWYDNDDIYISHALAMKWLREKGINICLDVSNEEGKWFYMIVRNFSKEETVNGTIGERLACGYFDTYEEAVEAALKYVLENLI